METTIDTTKVSSRRKLQFNCLDDIRAEVERMAAAKELRTLGNWTAGQVMQHLAVVMDKSIDGFTERPPAIVRFFLILLFKRRFLSKPMSAGFKLPAAAQRELVSAPLSTEESVQHVLSALSRLKTEARRVPHPVFGAYTRDEWDQVHCRHSELHLSFLVPVDS